MTPDSTPSYTKPLPRGRRCFTCFRPPGHCYCAFVTRVENRTEVVILQHRRERRHRFNTARLAALALRNSRIVIGNIADLARVDGIAPDAGLLYPGDGAIELNELPAEQSPAQLVVLDGTWHHTKTLLRAIPWLAQLPRYRLAPSAPSRYRIRREPNADALSTVEAIVAALRTLEAETQGLDAVLDAFSQMIDRQIAHPKAELGRRRNEIRYRSVGNIPGIVLNEPERLVVVYGETSPQRSEVIRPCRRPTYWVAERLGTGERFESAVELPTSIDDGVFAHWDLPRSVFDGAPALQDVVAHWREFLRPGDVLAAYCRATADLLPSLGSDRDGCLLLKSIDFTGRRYRSLEETIAEERIETVEAGHAGRAGRRVANAVALVRHLYRIGNEVRRRRQSDEKSPRTLAGGS